MLLILHIKEVQIDIVSINCLPLLAWFIWDCNGNNRLFSSLKNLFLLCQEKIHTYVSSAFSQRALCSSNNIVSTAHVVDSGLFPAVDRERPSSIDGGLHAPQKGRRAFSGICQQATNEKEIGDGYGWVE